MLSKSETNLLNLSGTLRYQAVSMENYISKTGGIGGKIKSSPEDFIVEEIGTGGKILEKGKRIKRTDGPGDFLHFVLEKRNWSTAAAVKTIAKRLKSSGKRFSYAGSKDKTAVTTQLCSAFRIPKESLISLKIKDISINGAWCAAEKVSLGSLLGNRFTIKVREVSEDAEATVKGIYDEIDGKFPNYFGPQRFGSSRGNTAETGELIVRRRYEEAAMKYLTDSTGEKNEQAVLARKELKEKQDFRAALSYFPKHLIMERSMLAHLAKNPNDFVGALRKLPRYVLLLFVHSFQSLVFNELLSERIGGGGLEPDEGEFLCGETLGFPDVGKKNGKWTAAKILGYESTPNEREKAVLEKKGISVSDFRIPGIPEISSKGTYRTLLSPLRDFSFMKQGKDGIFRFSLGSGSYATSALREFLDRKIA